MTELEVVDVSVNLSLDMNIGMVHQIMNRNSELYPFTHRFTWL
ncbi:hypothetical protein ACINKY_06635 [Paenibacillus illinoisensis]|uniref:Uncharacterized protein n=1 Tax=Paenibacillus illinoisensis TaxID=59845 RepID=A0ABW8HQE5_9BACL